MIHRRDAENAKAGIEPQAYTRKRPFHELVSILDRPRELRLREYQNRFAQSMVFGLPVVALQIWGPGLGGVEHPRWMGLFQVLLAGWVMYVGVAGVLFEGLLLASKRKLTGSLFVGSAGIGLYLLGVASYVQILAQRTPWPCPPQFHWAVLISIIWSASQWWRLKA